MDFHLNHSRSRSTIQFSNLVNAPFATIFSVHRSFTHHIRSSPPLFFHFIHSRSRLSLLSMIATCLCASVSFNLTLIDLGKPFTFHYFLHITSLAHCCLWIGLLFYDCTGNIDLAWWINNLRSVKKGHYTETHFKSLRYS